MLCDVVLCCLSLYLLDHNRAAQAWVGGQCVGRKRLGVWTPKEDTTALRVRMPNALLTFSQHSTSLIPDHAVLGKVQLP